MDKWVFFRTKGLRKLVEGRQNWGRNMERQQKLWPI